MCRGGGAAESNSRSTCKCECESQGLQKVCHLNSITAVRIECCNISCRSIITLSMGTLQSSFSTRQFVGLVDVIVPLVTPMERRLSKGLAALTSVLRTPKYVGRPRMHTIVMPHEVGPAAVGTMFTASKAASERHHIRVAVKVNGRNYVGYAWAMRWRWWREVCV